MTWQAADFWQFSLSVYEEPSVAENCLHLQDAFSLDVNLLLFCCWCGCQGVALSPSLLAPVITFSAVWQQNLLAPLRTCRRWLKTGQGSGIDDRPQTVQEIRTTLRQLELSAEKYQQSRLVDLITATLSGSSDEKFQYPKPDSTESCRALIRANLDIYIAAVSVTLPQTDRLLQPLIETSLTVCPLPAPHQP